MFDHVTLRVSDIDAARDFYEAALSTLEFEPPDVGGHFFEWNDLSISMAREDRPLTRRVHIGLSAPSRDHVDAFWRTLTERGYRDNGSPGPRPIYHEGYYGAFLLDPDGNNIEAVFHGIEAGPGTIDHIFLRVRDLDASRRFYETVSRPLSFGLWAVGSENDWVAFGRRTGSMWLTNGEPTENVHLAFPAPDRATVDEFHRIALGAGYRDNGPPGERPRYHEGYYGAFVLDPDGNNVEAVFHDR